MRSGQRWTVVFCLIGLAGQTIAATYTVSSSDDVDDSACNIAHCSLREAISASNNSPGNDRIDFNIPGPGVHTIQPLAALPFVTEATSLDGSMEDGNPGIELNGSIAAPGPMLFGQTPGLTLSDHFGSTVRGLIVNEFSHGGIVILSGGNHVIAGNYLGTDATGTVTNGNGYGVQELLWSGVVIANSSNNRIGASAENPNPTDRNLLSGNAFAGIEVLGFVGFDPLFSAGPAEGNAISGNYVGTNAVGESGLGNFAHGIFLQDAERTEVSANVIADNGFRGLPHSLPAQSFSTAVLLSGDPSDSVITGNLIGTDRTGTQPLGNGRSGISGRGTGIKVTDNVIANSGRHGMEPVAAIGWTIENNIIGSDSFRSLDFGNGQTGIAFAYEGGFGNSVRNNYIANNATEGVVVLALDGIVIDANTIVSNESAGLVLAQGTRNALITHNLIGVDSSGAAHGNSAGGVSVLAFSSLESYLAPGLVPVEPLFEAAFGPTVGPTEILIEGNHIAHNGGPGILIGSDVDDVVGSFIGSSYDNGYDGTATKVSVLGNSIFENAGLGIDLTSIGAVASSTIDFIDIFAIPVPDGVNSNDILDIDRDANDGQNYPLLAPNSVWNRNLVIAKGDLDSAANTTFLIELFASAAVDVTNIGEGEVFVGSFRVTTDSSGHVRFTKSIAIDVLPSTGDTTYLTATATDPLGNTSEFSPALEVEFVGH